MDIKSTFNQYMSSVILIFCLGNTCSGAALEYQDKEAADGSRPIRRVSVDISSDKSQDIDEHKLKAQQARQARFDEWCKNFNNGIFCIERSLSIIEDSAQPLNNRVIIASSFFTRERSAFTEEYFTATTKLIAQVDTKSPEYPIAMATTLAAKLVDQIGTFSDSSQEILRAAHESFQKILLAAPDEFSHTALLAAALVVNKFLTEEHLESSSSLREKLYAILSKEINPDTGCRTQINHLKIALAIQNIPLSLIGL